MKVLPWLRGEKVEVLNVARRRIVMSNRPPKHATFFSYDAQAMEESRRSREALYLHGIFVDASVNDDRTP